jgi:GDP-mannose 6-dehydrogenase
MKISILGLGYVGTVQAGCLASDGHDVIGVDIEQTKVDLINSGRSPIIEQDIGEIIRDQVAAQKLTATTDVEVAVRESDMAIVCVGTPGLANGSLDLKYVRRVCEQIGSAIREHKGRLAVVIRSTILPGTMRDVVIPTLEDSSGKRAGEEFGVCFNPEFLREGTAVKDFYNPPKTVIGELDQESGDTLASLYASLPGPLIRTEIETSEMVKYADNAWHAVKIGFANEIGNICKSLGVDSHDVMDIFCQDRKLNISPAYLKPGFAFGGMCLPKDLRALLYKAHSMDVTVPILDSVLPSNVQQVERGLRAVVETGNRKVGILGISFKAGTDDLRESPVVELAERLIGKGYDLRIYDHNVNVARVNGANRDYILKRIPHISSLMVPSIDEIVDHAETVVVGNQSPEFKDIPKRMSDSHVVVDLVRVSKARSVAGVYEGLCW